MNDLNQSRNKSDKSNKLQEILNKVTGKKAKEEDKFFRLCEIINFCGGYNNFMETPMPAIIWINKTLDNIQEQQEKMLSIKKPRFKK